MNTETSFSTIEYIFRLRLAQREAAMRQDQYSLESSSEYAKVISGILLEEAEDLTSELEEVPE